MISSPPRSRPIQLCEHATESCLHSDTYLTSNEVEDHQLVFSFIIERFHTRWPHSLRAMLWCIYYGFYQVSMSLVLVLSIDQVWEDWEDTENGLEPERDLNVTLKEDWIPGVKNNMILAVFATMLRRSFPSSQ